MPGAPPARPAPPRSLAEERPRGLPRPARGALPYRHSPVTRILAPPHLPAAALRPAPSGFPLSRRVRPRHCPGFPTPGRGPPACASPSLPAPPSLTPAPFPPLPALSPHLGVPNPTPAAAFRWAPALRGSHVVAPKPGREREAPPREVTLGRLGVQGDAAQPLGSFGGSRGTQAERHKWVAWAGRGGVVSRSHFGISLRTRLASP